MCELENITKPWLIEDRYLRLMGDDTIPDSGIVITRVSEVIMFSPCVFVCVFIMMFVRTI